MTSTLADIFNEIEELVPNEPGFDCNIKDRSEEESRNFFYDPICVNAKQKCTPLIKCSLTKNRKE
jgi:hypothetical protein